MPPRKARIATGGMSGRRRYTLGDWISVGLLGLAGACLGAMFVLAAAGWPA